MKILKKQDFVVIRSCVLKLQDIYFKEVDDGDAFDVFFENLTDLAYEIGGVPLIEDLQRNIWCEEKHTMLYVSVPRIKILTEKKLRRIRAICLDLIKEILVLKSEPLEQSLESYSQIANYFDLPRVKNIGYNGKE